MYVVFDVDSTVCHRVYSQYHHARDAAARLNKQELERYPNPAHRRTYSAYHMEFYENYVCHYEQRRSLISRELFWTRSNVQYYLCPSSETYWSR